MAAHMFPARTHATRWYKCPQVWGGGGRGLGHLGLVSVSNYIVEEGSEIDRGFCSLLARFVFVILSVSLQQGLLYRAQRET